MGVRAADVAMGEITLGMLGTGATTSYTFTNGTITLERGFIYRILLNANSGAGGANVADSLGNRADWVAMQNGQPQHPGFYRVGPYSGAAGGYAQGFLDARYWDSDRVFTVSVQAGSAGGNGSQAFTYYYSNGPMQPSTQGTVTTGKGGNGGSGVTLTWNGATVISVRGGNGGTGQAVWRRIQPSMGLAYNEKVKDGGTGGNGGGATSIAGVVSIKGTSATTAAKGGSSAYIQIQKFTPPEEVGGGDGETDNGGGNDGDGEEPDLGDGGEDNGGEGNEGGNGDGGNGEGGEGNGDGDGDGNGGEGNEGGNGEGGNGEGGNGNGEGGNGNGGNGEGGEEWPPYFGNNKTNWVLFWIPIVIFCAFVGACVGTMIWIARREKRFDIVGK